MRMLLRNLARLAFVGLICSLLVVLPAFFEQRVSLSAGSEETEGPAPLAELDIGLELFAKVERPTAMAHRYDDDALYVASKRGRIYALRNGEQKVLLDIKDELSSGFEQGLLGMAFTPDGRLMIINFTNKKNDSITRAYIFDGGKVDKSTGKDLLIEEKPAANHNAGNLAFGPDDYLYLTLGDGGVSGDPENNAQSLDTMLGKIHRIEVLPNRTYQVPSSNPFVRPEGDKSKKKVREEIWSYGFRNPWRFSFDRERGDLWIADVGRDRREEINVAPVASGGGKNYGWNAFEGTKRFKEETKVPKEHELPVHQYNHEDGRCAVTGGYVYRGSEIPELDGAYLYSDFCQGSIEAIRVENREVVEHRDFDVDVERVSSFGEDAEGELYVMVLTEGEIYRVVAADG